MINILFICHGNICRSPMAEYVMKELVEKNGLSSSFFIDSSATSNEEIGAPVHHGTRSKLREVGVPCGDHRAQQLRRQDYEKFDYLIGMEQYNIRNIMRTIGSDPARKVSALLDFTERPRDIDDPWYTGNFDRTYDDVVEGCTALLAHILEHDRDRL